jgi:hypothetical protein
VWLVLTRRSLRGALLSLGVLALLAACGQTKSSGDTAICDDPVCCAPVEFDAARSRAYLGDGQLELFLATRGENFAPDGPPLRYNIGQFDAEVSSSVTETSVCDAVTSTTAAGLNGQYCDVSTTSELSCGQEVSFEIWLRSTLRDEANQSVCRDAPFSVRVSWTAVLACPGCPAAPFRGDACDHPRSMSCGHRVVDDPFCGPSITSLPCTCNRLSETGERTWMCAVC